MGYRFQRGICKVCQLPESVRSEMTEWRSRHPRLKAGMLRAVGFHREVWYYHFHGLCKGRLPYWRHAEWQRRCEQGRRIARWKPGESGGGNRKGLKDKRPRRKPSGIKAAITSERQERAAKLEAVRQAVIVERQERLERGTTPSRAFF